MTTIEPEAKKRIRKRKLSLQLEVALRDAEAAATADVSTQRLVQTRLTTLNKMLAREQSLKLKRLLEQLAAVQAENARLAAELARLRSSQPVDNEIASALKKWKEEQDGNTSQE